MLGRAFSCPEPRPIKYPPPSGFSLDNPVTTEYSWGMGIKKTVEGVELTRKTRHGKYDLAIDVALLLGEETYGTATNALFQMVIDSPLYQATAERIERNRKTKLRKRTG